MVLAYEIFGESFSAFRHEIFAAFQAFTHTFLFLGQDEWLRLTSFTVRAFG